MSDAHEEEVNMSGGDSPGAEERAAAGDWSDVRETGRTRGNHSRTKFSYRTKNPFEYRRPRETDTDHKLDAILQTLKGVATKQDVGQLHRRVVSVEQCQERIERNQEDLNRRVHQLENQPKQQLGGFQGPLNNPRPPRR